MKRIPFLLTIILLSGISLIWVSCDKDDPKPEDIPDATDVNKFIWNGLKTYYFWTSDIPNLNDVKFTQEDSLNKFLNTYTDPEELFESLLYQRGKVDKWSFIVDDSKEIDDWISGISESMGYDFMLGRIGSSDNVFGYVRYVLKGSPAEKAGVKRGDFFMKVDNSQLTVQNYQNLLFSNKTYTLGMATVQNNTISLNNQSINMTAVEIHENPILLDSVYVINGQNVGYLMYNGFTAEDEKINVSYDEKLNEVFGNFKSKGVQKLIVDLRYNGGGSVQTATYLASMIYSTDSKKVFFSRQYNYLLQTELTKQYGNGWNIGYFANRIEKTDITAQTSINSLNLTSLYVITSNETASASELLINGLDPYISVKVIGENTTGKNVGSITVRDWDENGAVNTSHKWAMQPIVLKIANSAGFYDYTDGLQPDIEASEDITNMLPLGDLNEQLLKIAIDDIKGTKSAIVPRSTIFKPFKSSKSQSRFAYEMYDSSPFKVEN